MPNGQVLATRLREQLTTLDEFQSVASDAVAYLTASKLTTVLTTTAGRQHYALRNFQGTGRQIPLRPVNTDLYIDKPARFTTTCRAVLNLLKDLATNRGPSAALLKKHRSTIESGAMQRVFYTIQQSYGVACDVLMEDSNQARKHVGMKFEALVGATFKALEIGSGHLVFNIAGGEGEPRYRAETDFVIGPDKSVISTSSIHDPRETIVSVKGSSKDRMSKIFIDRLLLETIAGHKVKMIAIFHNDVQRKASAEVSGTFVANLFLIYSKYLRPLNAVYFVDPPPHIDKPAWKPYLKRFQELVTTDVWELIKPSV